MQNLEEAIAHNKTQLVDIIIKHSIRTIQVEFSGSGDDGCIDNIIVRDNDNQPIDCPSLDCLEFNIFQLNRGRVWNGTNWEQQDFNTLRVDNLVEQLIEPLVYELLEETEIDWVNNDGGYGSVEIEYNHNRIHFSINIYQRYTESSLEHSEEEQWCSDTRATPRLYMDNGRPTAEWNDIINRPIHPVTEDDFL